MQTAILITVVIVAIISFVILIRVFSAQNDSKYNDLENQIVALTEQNRNMNAQLTQSMNNLNAQFNQSINGLNENIRTYFRTLEDNLRIINDKLISETNNRIEKLTTDTGRQIEKLNEDSNTKIEKLYEQMNEADKNTAEQLKEINRIVSEKMQEILDRKINEAFATVTKNMTELGKSITEGQEAQKNEIKYQLNALKDEFSKIHSENKEAMDKIHSENKETMDKIRLDNQQSLDKINETVNEKLQKTLNDRITQSFETVNKRLSEVYEGLGEMKTVASGVKDLKNVLANVKTRGILGEIQLSAILEEILTNDQYETQFKLTPGSRDIVDFAIKLPGQEDGKYIYLPIDSKFPGGRWSDLAEAYEVGDPIIIKEKRKTLETEIKNCAKSISDKYIKPPYTTDFAIMFLPFEGLYSEVVNMGLVEILQREYKVNITGPSTMAATLNSLQMGFRTLAIQKKSGEVWSILEKAKKEFASFAKVLDSARTRLRQADEELNTLIGTRTNKINSALKNVTVLEVESSNTQDVLEIDSNDDE